MIKNQEQQNNKDSTHHPSLNNFTRKNKLTSNKIKRPYDKDDIDSDSSQELLNYPQLNEFEGNAEQNDSSQQNDFDSLNYGLSFEEDPTKQVPKEVNDLGNLIEGHGIQMLRIYEMTGRTKEAEQLKLQLEKAMQAKTQLEKISRLDFDRPKQELREAAEKFGIDLNDINVKNEFIKIQRKNINDINQWMQTNDPNDAQKQGDKSKKQKFNRVTNQEQELINQKKKIKKEKFIAEQNKLLVQSIFNDVDRLESIEKIETVSK